MAKVNIGGQAVIEGVMMKGRGVYAVSVRKSDGTITTDIKKSTSIMDQIKLLRWPILRGVAVFIESLVLGVKTLTFSAELYGEEDPEEKPSAFEIWLENKLGEKGEKIIMGITMAISFIFAIALFMVLPMLISRLFKQYVTSSFAQNIIEGAIRILIFLIYMKLISKMKDIQRTFQYHGAEHKTINCLEIDQELTVENVKGCSRLHKSCGTSFLFIVMIVSILVFTLFTTQILWQRTLIRIFMVPIIAGLSYEFIRWARLSPNNKLADFLSKPGMWLQKEFTTIEPDDMQIQVAIEAVKGVLKHEPIDK